MDGQGGDHDGYTGKRLFAHRRGGKRAADARRLGCGVWRGVVLRAAISPGHAGLGTAWLTGFALLAAPHRSILLIVGAVGLAGGAVLFWRQQRTASCEPGAFCTRPAVRSLTLAGLLVGLVLLYLGYVFA
jgi:hypothetical protein